MNVDWDSIGIGFLWVQRGGKSWELAEIYGDRPFLRLRVWSRTHNKVDEVEPATVSRWGPGISEPIPEYGRYQEDNELVDAVNGPQPTGDDKADLLVRLINEGPLLVTEHEIDTAQELLAMGLMKILDDGNWAVTNAGRGWLAGRRT